MKLSEYCNNKEDLWNKIENEKTEKLINYLNNCIDVDLFKIANTTDYKEVYSKLRGWIFKFYQNQLFNGLKFIGADLDRFKKGMIYSLILCITRDNPNTDTLYDMLKDSNIIEKIIVYEDQTYEIVTKDYGNIEFIKAIDNFVDDDETLDYIDKLGENVRDGCHEISLFLIERYEFFKAVTSICKKGIDSRYYHSFVLDDVGNVIDFTGNLIMSKKNYYFLNDVNEINCVNYSDFLNEKNKSLEFDESKTLFDLLRNALYRQYLLENE